MRARGGGSESESVCVIERESVCEREQDAGRCGDACCGVLKCRWPPLTSHVNMDGVLADDGQGRALGRGADHSSSLAETSTACTRLGSTT